MKCVPSHVFRTGKCRTSACFCYVSCGGDWLERWRVSAFFLCAPILRRMVAAESPDMSASSWMLCFLDFQRAIIRLSSAPVVFFLQPPRRPLPLAISKPDIVRSRIRFLSNSARVAKNCTISFPVAHFVLIPSDRERNCIPRSSRPSRIKIRSRREQASLSSLQTTSLSPSSRILRQRTSSERSRDCPLIWSTNIRLHRAFWRDRVCDSTVGPFIEMRAYPTIISKPRGE
jgi:hypothetical protein